MHQLTDLKSRNFGANSEMRTTGTRYLVDAALAAGVRRVVAQSIAWAYQAGDAPATEDVPLDLGASGSRLATVQGVAALEAAVRQAPEWMLPVAVVPGRGLRPRLAGERQLDWPGRGVPRHGLPPIWLMRTSLVMPRCLPHSWT
jgi:hypothetical protein